MEHAAGGIAFTRFDNRVAIVTGGAGVLGRAIGERLASEGAQVVLADIDSTLAEAAARDLSQAGDVVGLPLDVTNQSSVRELVENVVGRCGRVDFLINNAGINRQGSYADQTEEDWQAIIAVNLTGAFNMVQAVTPVMRDQGGGRIVNIGSRVWLGGGRPGYTVSKAGIVGLTRSAAIELGPYNITCNALAPSRIETPAVLAFWTPEQWAEIVRKETASTPLRRLATPFDVAAAAAFLCSPDASYITGEVIHVCGGSQLV